MTEERRKAGGVEIFLDNRQVFLLFFACTVILSLVFGLGVVVGRRVEHRAAPQPVSDPLAMLDQMGSQEADDESLTFHESLTGAKPKGAPALPPAKLPATELQPADQPKPADPKPAEPKPTDRPPEQKAAEAKAAEPSKTAPKTATKAAENKIAPKTETKTAENSKITEGGTYSLQLSSFQDRAEAEVFMQKLRTDGMKPYLVPTTIEGRGVWFRVRLGSFRTWEAAVAAKEKFERTQKLIAYVAKN